MSTAPRPITIDDLPALAQVHDPQAHGERVAWVVTSIDAEANTYTSAIWIGNEDGTNVRKLTSGTHRDANPRWSPDGSMIAFTSNRPPVLTLPKEEVKNDDKKDAKTKSADKPTRHPNQIWVIRIDGGEAQQVTNLKYGAGAASWKSDGKAITFSAQSDPEPDTAPMTNGGIADERIVRDLSYRFDGAGYLERYSHIWTVTLGNGEHSQITWGDVYDSDPQWQPDGDMIAFSSNRRDDRKLNIGPEQILLVPADGGDVQVIDTDDASFASPSWSEDGSRIAWVGHRDGNALTKNHTLWTANADGSNVRDHTAHWEVSVGDAGMSDIHGASEGRPIWRDEDIYFLASWQGSTHVYRISSQDTDDSVRVTNGNRRIGGFALTTDGVAYVSGTINRPKELFADVLDGSDEIQISHVNDDALAGFILSNAIDIKATAPDGKEIQAWLLPPANRQKGKRYPVILQIHGGPHAMYAYDFFHEMQAMAGKGYAVVFCNPRGSAGYGEEFCACTRARWGESDMPDVLAALEAAIAEVDWIDSNRMGVTGGSYGGYLTNWIVGHDQRFKAAVTQRCVSNFYSFFGTSDIGPYFGEFEFGGVPWRNADLLLMYSPISYVDAIHTPLLIVHSENDLRCPIEQAEQMFVSLKYLQREVGFVRIPEEGHELSRSGTPSRRKARLSHIIGWFDLHL